MTLFKYRPLHKVFDELYGDLFPFTYMTDEGLFKHP